MKTRSDLFLLLMLAAALACGSPHDSDTPHTDEVDPECPRQIDRETFQDHHLERVCEYTTECLNEESYPVERCVRSLMSHMAQQTCWHPCETGACVTWIEQAEECLDPPGATDEVCLEMFRCRPGE